MKKIAAKEGCGSKSDRMHNRVNLFRKHEWKMIFIILITLAFLIAIEIYSSKYFLKSTSYKIQTTKLSAPVRIVQLTDLHNSTFGENNQTLVKLVSEQAPDFILMTGDLLNAKQQNTKTATDLIADLVRIAPVYVSMGNHEIEYQKKYGTDVARLYTDAGAVVLDRQYKDVEVNAQKIRIGGIYGYCLPEKYLETDEADPEECAFLSEFQDTDFYTILMCHMPVCWLRNDGLEEWNVDCVFSGHVHGGQVILPGGGGLYAPDLGWFPGRLRGLYVSKDGNATLVLSTGLGSAEWVPRFCNTPEIVTLDISPSPYYNNDVHKNERINVHEQTRIGHSEHPDKISLPEPAYFS